MFSPQPLNNLMQKNGYKHYHIAINILTAIDVDPTKMGDCVKILQKLSNKDIIPLKELLSFEYTVTHKFPFSKIKDIYKIDKQNTYDKYML